jgi:hypothetical protein
MHMLLEHPTVLLLVTVVLFAIASWAGSLAVRLHEEDKSDAFQLVQGATLTLLGLLLGFTFAMAVTRFDLRMQFAVDETNALETAWMRAGTLPAPMVVPTRQLLRSYIDVRLELRKAGTNRKGRKIAEDKTDVLQAQLWAIAQQAAQQQRDAVSALYLDSLRLLFDMQATREELYDNRIPMPAWGLLIFIGIISNVLVGYGIGRRWWLLCVLPVVVAGTLMLIADLDTPRSGFIQVRQHSLDVLSEQLKP